MGRELWCSFRKLCVATLDRKWHQLIFFPQFSFFIISYLHIPPNVQAQNLQVVLDATHNPLGLVSYSSSCCLSSFLVHPPSPFTLQALLPFLLECCSCSPVGLPASNLLSPPISWPSHCHGDLGGEGGGQKPKGSLLCLKCFFQKRKFKLFFF